MALGTTEDGVSAELYPLGSQQVVVGSGSCARVVAAVGTTHEVLQYKPNVYEADVVVRRKVAL